MANPSLQQEDNEYESEIPTSSWGRFLSADQAEGDQAFTSQPLVDANVNFNHVGEKSEIVDKNNQNIDSSHTSESYGQQ